MVGSHGSAAPGSLIVHLFDDNHNSSASFASRLRVIEERTVDFGTDRVNIFTRYQNSRANGQHHLIFRRPPITGKLTQCLFCQR